MAPPASDSDENPTTPEKALTPPPPQQKSDCPRLSPARICSVLYSHRPTGFFFTQDRTCQAPVDSVEVTFDNPVGSDVEEELNRYKPLQTATSRYKPLQAVTNRYM
ncbi:hypothetical protein KEM48_006560 [Puccinia striiformis f. sp. tritici PST-130]|nr:hypothetical protein KEM48_006560 [Puccinia striiformis f. sp. tritici PST-130]